MAKRARPNPSSVDDGNSDVQDAIGGSGGVDSGSVDASAAASGDSGSTVDPASFGGSNNDSGTGGRKPRSDRGRARGPRADKAQDKIDLGDFAQILSEIHSGVAMMVNVPELALDEANGEHVKLSRAIQRVMRHYDLPSVSPIALDYFMLIKTAGLVYGSRIIAYNLRQRAERARPINQPAQVQTGQPAAPQAPQQAAPKAANAPPVQPTRPVQFTPPPGAVRAATIPGFENIDIVVPMNPNHRN